MGIAILSYVLENWQSYELDDSLYFPIGTEPSLGGQVNILPLDPMRRRIFEGQQYLLGIEQVRDAIIALEIHLRRTATPIERLRAVLHYARFDAFIDPNDAAGDEHGSG
jgi:hypothetical protein